MKVYRHKKPEAPPETDVPPKPTRSKRAKAEDAPKPDTPPAPSHVLLRRVI